MWGGPGVEPHGLQYILHIRTNQYKGAMWQPLIGPRGIKPPIIERHVSSHHSPLPTNRILPCHRMSHHCIDGTALPRHRTDCTDRYSQHLKFLPCLAWRTDCDISFIRTPFEKVNIPRNQEDKTDAMALFSSHSDHFEN
jgi:hypothetical protein